MSLKSAFNDMLKAYNAVDMIEAEIKKRSYYVDKLEMDKGWTGGAIPLPVEAGEASSMGFEGLVDTADIAKASYLRGSISTMKEFVASQKFDQRDLEKYGDLKKSFLKILPESTEKFVKRMAERLNIMLLADGAICSVTANGAVDGTLTVDVPTLLTLNEKVQVKSAAVGPITGYIKTINKPAATVRLTATRGGTDYIDLSTVLLADKPKVYLPSTVTGGFTSLKQQLLPASLGGSDTWFSLNKSDAPVLQATYYDGSSMNSTNFLSKLFEFYIDTVFNAEGNPTEAVMNMKHFTKIVPSLEGSRRFAVTDKSAGYGFRKITLIGPEGGEFTITGVRDMPIDLIYIMDWSKHKFYSDKFIERIKNPDGLEYFTERVSGANGGYSHICDYRLYGELAVVPSGNSVIYNVPA